MSSRRPCIVLTGLCKEKTKNLNKLKKDVVETLCETRISKEKITINIGKFHRIGRTDRNNFFKSHSFKEKIYFKRKAITLRDQTIINKIWIKLLKDTNTLVTDSPGTNFLFAYADVHGNLKIRLKDARNRREVIRFAIEKDFNNLFAKSF